MSCGPGCCQPLRHTTTTTLGHSCSLPRSRARCAGSNQALVCLCVPVCMCEERVTRLLCGQRCVATWPLCLRMHSLYTCIAQPSHGTWVAAVHTVPQPPRSASRSQQVGRGVAQAARLRSLDSAACSLSAMHGRPCFGGCTCMKAQRPLLRVVPSGVSALQKEAGGTVRGTPYVCLCHTVLLWPAGRAGPALRRRHLGSCASFFCFYLLHSTFVFLSIACGCCLWDCCYVCCCTV